jgi:MFS transporter, FSR family, fosmidomycin resistance protein
MATALATTQRDVKVISLIGVAHFFSHYFQLALPALFPLIHEATGIGYTRLGLLATVFFVTSGLAQTPAGFLVDRIGARPVLIGGLILLAGSIALYGVSTAYPFMILLAVLAGLGNSIFHPADYSILTASVTETRIGRAYSVHGIGGFLGYAAAPVAMLALGNLFGWQQALLISGLAGLVVAAALWLNRGDLHDGDGAARARRRADAQGGPGSAAVLLRPSVLLCFLFFALIAMGQVGLMTLGPSALIQMLGTPLAVANGSVTALLIGVVAGVMLGGIIADRTDRHDVVTATVLIVACGLLLMVPVFAPGGYVLLGLFVVVGLFYGIQGPARDMVVRGIAPAEARGKVFGFTYSGLDFGSGSVALLFGAMLEAGLGTAVFYCIVVFMLSSIGCIVASQHFARRDRARAAATAPAAAE